MWLILTQLRGSRDSHAQWRGCLQLSAFSPGSPRWQGVHCRKLGQLGFRAHVGRQARSTKPSLAQVPRNNAAMDLGAKPAWNIKGR